MDLPYYAYNSPSIVAQQSTMAIDFEDDVLDPLEEEFTLLERMAFI